jgi:hypothetical protein
MFAGGFGAGGGGGDFLSGVPQKYQRQSGGSFKKGLPRVPFDEFPAILHEGEAVLPAGEANLYRELKAEGAIPQTPQVAPPVDDLMNATRPRRIGPEPPVMGLNQSQPDALIVQRQGNATMGLNAPTASSPNPGMAFLGSPSSPLAHRLSAPTAVDPQSGFNAGMRLNQITAETPSLVDQRKMADVPFKLIPPSDGQGTALQPTRARMGDALQLTSEPHGSLASQRLSANAGDRASYRIGADDFVDLQDELTSPDPAVRDAAMRQVLGSAYEDVAPGRSATRLRAVLDEDTSPHKHGMGIGERFMHGLKTAGLAVAHGDNPLVAAVEGVVGGANPNMYHHMRHNLIDVPGAQREAAIENQQQQQNLNRSAEFGASAGVNRYTGRPTVAAQNANRQSQEFAFNIHKFNAQQQTEQQKHALDLYKSWADRTPNGTPIPDYMADAAGIPRGAKVYHHSTQGPVLRTQDGSTFRVGDDNKAVPVTVEGTGETLRQYTPPPSREPRDPEYVYSGRAQAELEREHGISDSGAMVDNPAFAEAFAREKAADAEEAAGMAAYGIKPASDAEITARVAKKVPPKIRAGTLITPDMIRARAAEIYLREGGGAGRAVSPGPGSSPAKPNAAELKVDEDGYQQLYEKMKPEDLKKYEDKFKAKYGRLPHKPKGK